MNEDVKKCLLRALSERHAGEADRAFIALYDAIDVLNESAVHKSELPKPDPRVFRHDFTTEELEQREKTLKPLTLSDLKRQVENAIAWQKEMPNIFLWGTPPPEGVLWLFGDFEIRRRK